MHILDLKLQNDLLKITISEGVESNASAQQQQQQQQVIQNQQQQLQQMHQLRDQLQRDLRAKDDDLAQLRASIARLEQQQQQQQQHDPQSMATKAALDRIRILENQVRIWGRTTLFFIFAFVLD